jgi:hypothetical protein
MLYQGCSTKQSNEKYRSLPALMQSIANSGKRSMFTMNPDQVDPKKGPCFVRGYLYGADTILDRCDGCDYYFMDNGYLVDRKRYSRLTKNWWFVTDLKAPETLEDMTRISKFKSQVMKEVKPWKKDGSYILVCPSSSILEKRMLGPEYDEGQWLEETVEELKKHTDRPIKVRKKLVHKPGDPKKLNPVPIDEDMKNAYACVTLGSVCAIDALKIGIPSFSSPRSMVKSMSRHELSEIENPLYPDNRELFFETLLLNQFNYNEFLNGTAWEYISRHD